MVYKIIVPVRQSILRHTSVFFGSTSTVASSAGILTGFLWSRELIAKHLKIYIHPHSLIYSKFISKRF